MKILLTGATGFIGRRLRAALAAQGHELRCIRRARPGAPRPSRAAGDDAHRAGGATEATTWFTLDYARATRPQDWAQPLQGCEAVINAAGILRSRGANTLERMHVEAPRALFEAARAHGVARIIHISALGADEQGRSAYHVTKKAGDDVLRRLGLPYTILQPSLVFGPEGASAQLFLGLACLPVTPLPGGADAMIQPVHIDDLVSAVLCLLSRPADRMPPEVPVVGPTPLALRDYLLALRGSLGIRSRGRYVVLPRRLVAAAARAGDWLRVGLLDSDTLRMLQRGNTGDPAPLQRLIGAPPRAPAHFVDPPHAAAMAARARLSWLLPVLRWSIALVWIVTAAVSAFGYPMADSLALLARAGVPGPWQPLALYGAIALDLLFGVALLLPRRPRWIWAAQAGLIVGYTVIITVRLPEFWLHPYGPLTKNLPMLAALWLLCELEDRPWRS